MKIEHTKEIQKLKAQLQPVQTGQQASSSSRFFGSRNEPLDNERNVSEESLHKFN